MIRICCFPSSLGHTLRYTEVQTYRQAHFYLPIYTHPPLLIYVCFTSLSPVIHTYIIIHTETYIKKKICPVCLFRNIHSPQNRPVLSAPAIYTIHINLGEVQRCRNESTCWYNHTHLHHPTTLPLSTQANAGCWLNVCPLHSRASLQANVHTAGCMYLIPPKTKHC